MTMPMLVEEGSLLITDEIIVLSSSFDLGELTETIRRNSKKNFLIIKEKLIKYVFLPKK